jgi:hypothetical protein
MLDISITPENSLTFSPWISSDNHRSFFSPHRWNIPILELHINGNLQYVLFLFFKDRISICNPGWPWTFDLLASAPTWCCDYECVPLYPALLITVLRVVSRQWWQAPVTLYPPTSRMGDLEWGKHWACHHFT